MVPRFALAAAVALATITGTATSAEAVDTTTPRAVSRGPASPAREDPFRVIVLGDGFATTLAEGLRSGIGVDPAFAIQDVTRPRAGLSSDGDADVTALAASMLSGPPPGIAVVMFGLADAVAVRAGAGGQAEIGSPDRSRAYGARVAALAASLTKAGVPVIWVGLPIVADEAAAAGFAALNEVVREQAAAAGFRFVDSWNAFSDDAGRYQMSGPDRNGRPARLRTADGRGLTRDGALKLASFVEGDIRRARDARAARSAVPGEVVAVARDEPAFDNDVGAQIRRELGLPAIGPGRPDAIGPVVIVTAPPWAADGELTTAGLGPAPLANAGGSSLVERTLVQGRPLPPKPGRIDDFSWPKGSQPRP